MEGSDQRQDDPLTRKIIGAAIEVHRRLGPGLLESTYETCLCYEMNLLGAGKEANTNTYRLP
jgi:GxxExxY protein